MEYLTAQGLLLAGTRIRRPEFKMAIGSTGGRLAHDAGISGDAARMIVFHDNLHSCGRRAAHNRFMPSLFNRLWAPYCL